jgi:hypothetical protein
MKTITTIAELRDALNQFQDSDQVVIEDNDENGDVIDLHSFYIDDIKNVELTTGEKVSEIRMCKIPNDIFISDEVYLQDDLEEENPQTVTYRLGTFYSKSNIDGCVRRFKCLKHPDELSPDEACRVLKYCLGHFTGVVDLRDIFLEGTYIKEIK